MQFPFPGQLPRSKWPLVGPWHTVQYLLGAMVSWIASYKSPLPNRLPHRLFEALPRFAGMTDNMIAASQNHPTPTAGD